MKISPSKEDYLKAIHSLDGAEKKVSNKSIAGLLSVSSASVSEMNARLVKEKLISHIPYKGVQLTEEGIKSANLLIRKHRLWEVFLYEKLGFQWSEVHAEADRLEHASSDLLVERLAKFLEHPKYDPHGGIIPNADGTVSENTVPLHPLGTIDLNARFRIKEVADDRDLLTYLFENNITLNHDYQLIDKDSFDNSVSILDLQENKKLRISGKAINNIQVSLFGENNS